MGLCHVDADADMYGLGIRLGFYLQWMAQIVARFLLVQGRVSKSRVNEEKMTEEFKGVQFALVCFVGATFIAIIYQAIAGPATVVDLYISLLVCFGTQFFLVPVFVWRVVTGFRPEMDPTRWAPINRTARNKTLWICNHSLTIASAVFQLWFWIKRAPQPQPDDCKFIGFLFSRLPLDSLALRVVNIAFQSVSLGMALIEPGSMILGICIPKLRCLSKPTKVKVSKRRDTILQWLYSLMSACIFAVNVAAIEFSISWNDLGDVNSMKSAGQLIPFVVGIMILLRVIWKYQWQSDGESGQDEPRTSHVNVDEDEGASVTIGPPMTIQFGTQNVGFLIGTTQGTIQFGEP